MWAVMTKTNAPTEREYRGHAETGAAWDDYANRILDLETHGYTRERKRQPCTADAGAASCTAAASE